MRTRIWGPLLALSVTLASREAAADPDGEADGDEPPHAVTHFPSLSAPSTFAGGLEGYGGVSAGATRGESRAHTFVGGLARLRFHYLQIGGFVEGSDADRDARYRTLGGFAGLWIPYARWVDLEGSVGIASRAYSNPSTEYGAAGLDVHVPTLVLRAGVSDRTTEQLFGARIGAAIVFSTDLKSEDVAFRRTYTKSDGTVVQTTGTTPIGGVFVGLVLAIGLELGGGARTL